MFKTIGVIGAGKMGHGIAQVCAQAGSQVILYDINEAILIQAKKNIENNLKRSLKEHQNISIENTLKRIQITNIYDPLASADLIIEAVKEDERLKRSIFKDIIPYIKESTLLASNTSSISITRLAANTDRPEKFCGVHFMNPVPAIPLVELIRGLATNEDTFQKCKRYVEDILKKNISVSEDFPGFIVNRILAPMINEAIYTLYEGIGNVQAIDTAIKLGAKHPLGPLELADFIGLDTILSILNVLHSELVDSKYRPCPLLIKYVEAGWLGRKTKRGFYDYTSDIPTPTR